MAKTNLQLSQAIQATQLSWEALKLSVREAEPCQAVHMQDCGRKVLVITLQG